MKLDNPSWLPVPSPNFHPGRGRQQVSGVVMHFTAAGSGKGTAEYFAKRSYEWKGKTYEVNASSHIVIDRDGTVYQCVSMRDRAWHAGPATLWKGQKLARGMNVNDFTVGIELANWGELKPDPERPGFFVNYLGKPFKAGLLYHSQMTTGVLPTVWEGYPEPQINGLIQALKFIVHTYPAIKREDVLGHEQIQDNKDDPGPAFPWARVLDATFGNPEQDHQDELDSAEDDDRRGYYDEEAEMCLVKAKL